ncbi:division/cell wall cluster transcriptional repressor MraZ [bacterium CPR1]|nr:division/cell wall cluster transcriptional repressor MraZ [bacterium CPR1]
MEETHYLFSGTYEHSLDDKGRLTIPSSFRKDFMDGAVLRKDKSGCVEILPRSAWNLFLEKLRGISRTDAKAQRWVTHQLAGALQTELDKQGRVLLGNDMRAHAGLQGGSVVVTGALDRLKVWSSERWTEFEAEADAEDLDEYVNQNYQI